MPRFALRPVALSLTLALVPIGLLGCPALQGPNKSNTTGAITPATQSQSLKTNIAALKSNIRELVATGMSLNLTGQQAGSSMKTQSLDRGIQAMLHTLAAGTFSMYGATWTWGADDQIASLVSPSSAMTFAFTGKGEPRRTATINVSKLPDGTYGSGQLDITSSLWVDYPSFVAPPTVTAPSPTPSGNYYSPAPISTDSYSYYNPSPTPIPTPHPLASVQIWYNQFPGMGGLQNASGKLEIVPQGEASKRIDLQAGASGFESFTLGSSTIRIPTHCYLRGTLPKVALDQALDIRRAGSTQYEATLTGTITLASVAGPQLWNENVIFSYDTSNVLATQMAFTYENVAQKYKLVGTAKPATDQYGTTGTVVEGRFISTLDNTQLATLSFDSRKGVAPIITYADGTTEAFSQSDFMPVQ